MAELTGFHYRPGTSRLHRLDVRLKLALLAAAALVSLKLGAAGLVVLALLVLFQLAAAGCLPRFRGMEWRTMGLLLGLVFCGRALSMPGEEIIAWGPVALTREGAIDGALAALRLGTVFLLGAAFVAATRPAEIKAGVEWLLKPLPGVNARRAGTTIGLLIRFIPVVWEQAAAVADAQRARAIEQRRNPLRRAACFGIALMRRLFISADTLALAMEARGYRDDRTGAPLAVRPGDWPLFAAALAALVLLAAA